MLPGRGNPGSQAEVLEYFDTTSIFDADSCLLTSQFLRPKGEAYGDDTQSYPHDDNGQARRAREPARASVGDRHAEGDPVTPAVQMTPREIGETLKMAMLAAGKTQDGRSVQAASADQADP